MKLSIRNDKILKLKDRCNIKGILESCYIKSTLRLVLYDFTYQHDATEYVVCGNGFLLVQNIRKEVAKTMKS